MPCKHPSDGIHGPCNLSLLRKSRVAFKQTNSKAKRMRDLIEMEEAEIAAARIEYAIGMEALGLKLTNALYAAAQRHADARAARLRVYDGETVIPLPKATTEPMETAVAEAPEAPADVEPVMQMAAE